MEQERQLKLHLQNKMANLTTRQQELQQQLDAGFDVDVLRSLNLLQHNIECCQNRLNGKFTNTRAEFEITVPKINY
jgi:hypothetical protein